MLVNIDESFLWFEFSGTHHLSWLNPFIELLFSKVTKL